MKPKKPIVRETQVVRIDELSPHLRRIVVAGASLKDFPIGLEGSYVKVVITTADNERKMRSYTIRSFNQQTTELALDFVVNMHRGPATDWASAAKIGDRVAIAGPGPIKLTDYSRDSYLLVGDITSINAINGYMPRFNQGVDARAILAVPTRRDIIEMDYDTAKNTTWFVEDEATLTLEESVKQIARGMAEDTQVFMGLEAGRIRSLRPILQDELGISRLNIATVGYWKRGVDADRFGVQKRTEMLRSPFDALKSLIN